MKTIPTKDVGDVKNRRGDGEYKWILEEGNEDYIKRSLGIDG